MKKSVNIFGLLFVLMLITGVIFKKFHMAGAGVLVTSGIFFFVTIYLPMFIISLRKQMMAERSGMSTIFLLTGSVGIVGLIFGILAKIMHWPGAAIGLWGGTGVLILALLLFILFKSGKTEKISMISVLIVIIILGTFSFNTFRSGNIRSFHDAYSITGTSFSETSKLFWNECEMIIQQKVIADTTGISPSLKTNLLKMHTAAQEIDLHIGQLIEKIRRAESQFANLDDPAEQDEKIRWSLFTILSTEKGISDLDIKIKNFQDLLLLLDGFEMEKRLEFSKELDIPFNYRESDLIYQYLGPNSYESEPVLNGLFLWKSKIWETEFKILSIVKE